MRTLLSSVLAGALVVGSAASAGAVTLTFDEIPFTNLSGGVTVNGVTFTSSLPWDTFYNSTGGPNASAPPSGNVTIMDNNVLEGNATATLTMLFANPVSSFDLAAALDSEDPLGINPGMAVTLYDTSLNPLPGPLTLPVAPLPTYAAGTFTYNGSLGNVLKAVLTFDATSGAPRPGGGRFAIDNLNYTLAPDQGPAPVPEPTTLVLLGTGLAGTFARARRKRQGNG